MTNRLFLALILVFVLNISKGQAPFPLKDEIKQFTLSKTCIVLDDDQFSPYNAYIRKSVPEFWKITQFEFIGAADFEARRKDPSYSFIILTSTNYSRDKSGSEYTYINLLQGKNVEEIGKMPEICAVPLSSTDEDDLDYGYKLGAVLSFMQKHASMIAEDPTLTGRRYLKYYNRFTPDVHKRRILVKSDDLSPEISSLEKIKAIYGYDIEIVSEDEIVNAIRSKTSNTLILHKVGPPADKSTGYCYKMLIGTDDAGMYYYNQHTIDKANPNALLPADLKRMAKTE